MNSIPLNKIILVLVIIGLFGVSFITLHWWFTFDPSTELVKSVPGLDNRPLNLATSENRASTEIGQYFQAFTGIPSVILSAWPRFRGAAYDNISREGIRLKTDWSESGPEILWSIELGEGHAAPAVMNGRVYILDYDEEVQADALRCFSLDTGEEIWRRWYRNPLKRNHGMSRTIPAVSDKYVVTIGPQCHVMCSRAQDGEFLWGIDLEQAYHTKIPFWYTGQCPLIEDDVAIIAPGGSALIIGVNCETGQVKWQTPNPHNWQMSHSSIMPMVYKDTKMYVYCAVGGVVGVAARGDNKGEILWETDAWNHSVVAPSPVILDKGRIFLTAGYSAGSMMLQLKRDKNGFSAQVLAHYAPKDGIASEQQTPIFYNGYLFAILPKDAGALRNQFVCSQPDDLSKMTWTSGKTNRFGLGPYLVADGKFFILDDSGVLTMIKASTKEYVQLAQAQVLEGSDAWGPMAIVDGRLLLRDSQKMVCLNVRD